MRLLMTMFGWADAGGGTIFPRQIAHTLAQRGHEVTVVYAAAVPWPRQSAYAVREHEEQGVRLVGIHNRATAFLDDKDPAREVHDPEIVRAMQRVLAERGPQVVHFHNFLGLSAGIVAAVHASGAPSCYTPYNFWLVCPTLYLTLPGLSVCGGVDASGTNCLGCTKAKVPGAAYLARRDRLREALAMHTTTCLATSANVRDVLLANGYEPDQVRLLRLGNARAERLWHDGGCTRASGVKGALRLGFTGSLLPIKGVHLLVAAAQRLQGAFEVHLHGDGPPDYLTALRALDRRNLVQFHGRFEDAQHAAVLAALHVGVVPSVCLDHSPLVVDELQAARVPVVGARIGGIPDYVQPEAGALFPAGDANALAACLQRLIDNPTIVAAWQQRLLPPPSYSDYVDALEATYRDLHVRGPVLRSI